MIKRLFFFNYVPKKSESLKVDILSIWTTSSELTVESLNKEVESFQSSNKFLLDNIALFIPDDLSINIKESRLNNKKRKLLVFKYDKNGSFVFKKDDSISNDDALKESIEASIENIKTQAMVDLFSRNHALLELHGDYHFATLGGKHSDKFIKVSNVLVNKNEIDFISIFLLKYLKENIKRIYIDTSTIYSLLLNAVLLKRRLDQNYQIPLIHNFQSYHFKEHIDDLLSSDYMIFISTSSSGDLKNKLLKAYKATDDNVITIYYFGETEDSNCLCNLSKNDSLKASKPHGYTPEECPFCKEGSQVVHIANEQFILEMQEPEAVRITIHHKPDGSLEFFEKYTNKGVLKFGGYGKFRFYIDEAKLLEVDNFKEHLDYILSAYGAKKVKTIIHTDGSNDLANHIKNSIAAQCDVKSYEDYINSKHDANATQTDSVIVVSGSIHSGLTIENISRHLRVTHKDSLRIYIIGILKTTSKKAYDFLRLNLVKHHKFGQDHIFLPIEKIYLPKLHNGKTTWDKELELLRHINCEDSQSLQVSKNDILEKRIKTLEGIKKTPCTEGIFWNAKSTADTPLKIAPGFAFLNETILSKNPTQADILYTFASVIQNSREVVKESGEVKNLKSTPYKQKVIAPNNFTRFNDSILQACLLRICFINELNYSSSRQLSKIMKSIILDVIKNHENTVGEAAMEFIVALAIGQLKLHNDEKNELLGDISGFDLPEHFKLIIKEIK